MTSAETKQVRANKSFRFAILTAVIAVALVGATSLALSSAHATKAKNESAAVYVVKFHADWCGSCKTLGPVMTDLENKLEDAPVLFVELDLTNSASKKQAQFMARALGLDSVWKANAPKTGFLLVVDGNTKRPLEKLTKAQSLKQMTASIRKHLR